MNNSVKIHAQGDYQIKEYIGLKKALVLCLLPFWGFASLIPGGVDGQIKSPFIPIFLSALGYLIILSYAAFLSIRHTTPIPTHQTSLELTPAIYYQLKGSKVSFRDIFRTFFKGPNQRIGRTEFNKRLLLAILLPILISTPAIFISLQIGTVSSRAWKDILVNSLDKAFIPLSFASWLAAYLWLGLAMVSRLRDLNKSIWGFLLSYVVLSIAIIAALFAVNDEVLVWLIFFYGPGFYFHWLVTLSTNLSAIEDNQWGVPADWERISTNQQSLDGVN